MKKMKVKSEKTIIETVDGVEKTIESALEKTDKIVEPVRRSVLRRYPTLFLVTVTFGVASTFFAFERIISEIALLNDRPWLILCLGIGVLVGTGTLYKKLG